MDYSGQYDPDTDFDRWYTFAASDVITALVRPDDQVLELGCGTGLMTADLVQAGARVLAVEHSAEYLERARARDLVGVDWVQANLDDWELPGAASFDHVIMTNVLHEVALPDRLLRLARAALNPRALAHLSLQNPLSIHRHLGQAMGLIEELDELSALGQSLGSHGLWNADDVQAMAEDAGLHCVFRRGLMLKPLPKARMADLPDDFLLGLKAAAMRFPESCAMNYLLLSPAHPITR
jgi:2-polyprenyl-3-methyl-5-hydroxy-6-metoxy-1,4-benzoquinol methylase